MSGVGRGVSEPSPPYNLMGLLSSGGPKPTLRGHETTLSDLLRGKLIP